MSEVPAQVRSRRLNLKILLAIVDQVDRSYLVIHHQRAEAKTKGIYVENPSQPHLLGLPLDDVSTSEDEKRDDGCCETNGDVEIWAKTANGSEE